MSLKSAIIKRVVKDYVLPSWARKARKRNSNALLWMAAGAGAVLATRALTKKLLQYDLHGKSVRQESYSEAAPSMLTALDEKAAKENSQIH